MSEYYSLPTRGTIISDAINKEGMKSTRIACGIMDDVGKKNRIKVVSTHTFV
jgi:hypothetical protein